MSACDLSAQSAFAPVPAPFHKGGMLPPAKKPAIHR